MPAVPTSTSDHHHPTRASLVPAPIGVGYSTGLLGLDCKTYPDSCRGHLVGPGRFRQRDTAPPSDARPHPHPHLLGSGNTEGEGRHPSGWSGETAGEEAEAKAEAEAEAEGTHYPVGSLINAGGATGKAFDDGYDNGQPLQNARVPEGYVVAAAGESASSWTCVKDDTTMALRAAAPVMGGDDGGRAAAAAAPCGPMPWALPVVVVVCLAQLMLWT